MTSVVSLSDKRNSLLHNRVEYFSKHFYDTGICTPQSKGPNKLECLAVVNLSSLVQCLRVRPEAHRIENLKGLDC
jgi:hypothetical protein